MKKLSDTFRTPVKEIYKPLDEVFSFFWDACCDKDNCLVEDQKTFWDDREYDYLTENLLDNFDSGYENCSIFMNPPYSKSTKDHDGIDKFIKKAWEDSKHFRVVMLLKADMSTKWFNYALKENNNWIMHINQGDMDIGEAAQELLDHMDGCCACSPKDKKCTGCDDKDPRQHQIGVLHLRNRVKFYVSEEVFEADRKLAKHFKNKFYLGIRPKFIYHWVVSIKDKDGNLIETKNYKRVEDGIISKSGANFPSMIMIFDRRGNK